MRKTKLILLTLAGVACLTGCSLFEKAESEDMDAIMDVISKVESSSGGEEVTEEDTETTGDSSDMAVEVTNDTSIPTVAGDAMSVGVTEGASLAGNSTQVVEAKTFVQGETSDVAFKSDEMSTAVVGKVTLDSVIRGADAQYIINMYNSENPEQQIQNSSNPDLEFCVVNYTIDLEATEGVSQTSTKLSCNIGGADATPKLQHNGKVYDNFPTLYNTTGCTVASGESGNGQIIFMLPVGCTSYSITFGEQDVQTATYVFK